MILPVPPPIAVVYIAVAIFAVVVFTGLRGKGNRRLQLIRIAVAAVMIGGLLIFIYRPSSISINGEGITSTRGGKLAIPWSSVTQAVYVPHLATSEYRTTSKIRGTALGSYRVGTFATAGAGKARVIAQQQNSALVVKAGGSLYEFAPDAIDRMTTEVAKHIPVAGWPKQR